MGKCYITRRGTKTSGTTKQLGVYPTGEDGRPTGDVTVLDNVITLSEYLFKNNGNITTVTLPDNLQTISDYSFQSCAQLTSINIPSNCISIGDYAFNNCTNLTSVIVSENANYTLGQYAFQSSGVTDESAKNILNHAGTTYPSIFYKCLNLIDVEAKFLWTNMFSNCTNLKTVKMTNNKSSNSKTGDDVFYEDTALEQVILGDGITTIGQSIFYGCTSLKTVFLPSSITTATRNSLTNTSSSYYVFFNCTALEDVQLGQDWNMSLRLNVSNNITVESMVAMFNSLKDLTGETAKTLTLGSTNLAKLTDEQKAIAINKNWTLA